jgi:hypothetical protein
MDDLDDRVRAAMKALDERAAASASLGVDGADLEAKVLARLAQESDEMNDLNTQGTGDASDGAPPRLENSGLHDIKALAKTTRQRVSRRITSQHDIDEQLLTSSQSGLRAVALPEPAKLVSLPSVAELAERASEPAVARAAHKVAARSGRPRRAPVAWIGAGVAAAAAIVIGVIVVKGNGGGATRSAADDRKDEQAMATARADHAAGSGGGMAGGAPAREEVASATSAAGSAAASGSGSAAGAGSASGSASGSALAEGSGSAAVAPVTMDSGAGSGTASGSSATDTPAIEKDRERGHGPVVKGGDAGRAKDQPPGGTRASGGSGDKNGGKDAHKTGPGGAAGSGAKPGGGGKSLDDLIDEAAGGSNDTKKPASGNAAPVLDKKELTPQDIRTAMGSAAKRAQACYDKFNQAGTVGVKASVAPSGKITKVTITGAFAGTPTGDCVAGVVEGVSFPAWDGAPMTVNYSYLLSE